MTAEELKARNPCGCGWCNACGIFWAAPRPKPAAPVVQPKQEPPADKQKPATLFDGIDRNDG
jgi:hypothetical protein